MCLMTIFFIIRFRYTIMKWLIWGASGWIGHDVCNILYKMNEEVVEAQSRADDEQAVEEELLNVKPDRVVSLI